MSSTNRHPAPAPVRGLQVASSSSGSLTVSWQAGPGRAERVWTLLRDQDGVLLKNISLQNTAASVLLDHLRPGTTYTITVVTEAVGLHSSASIQAVTGEYCGMSGWGLGSVSWLLVSTVLSAGSRVRPEAAAQRQLAQPAGLVAPCRGRGGLVSAEPVGSRERRPGAAADSQRHPGAARTRTGFIYLRPLLERAS